MSHPPAQLELLQGGQTGAGSRLVHHSPRQCGKTAALRFMVAPKSTRDFVDTLLLEHVHAFNSERSRRCEGEAKIKASREAVDGGPELAREGMELLERAAHHHDRTLAIAKRLELHVTYPLSYESLDP